MAQLDALFGDRSPWSLSLEVPGARIIGCGGKRIKIFIEDPVTEGWDRPGTRQNRLPGARCDAPV
ncbi:MAG: hypothetical protein L0228_08475 [Planctomycetes bacterium]|nr:hypothetical protein [Planctomycetota bacterium]